MTIPPGKVARFGHGLQLPFRALGMLASRPGLWPMAAAPIVLGAIGFFIGMFGGRYAVHGLVQHVWPEPDAAMAHAFWAALQWTMTFTFALALALVAPMVLAAPFLDKLSAQVEALVLGSVPAEQGLARMAREVATSVVNACARLLRFGVVQAVIFVLAFIPVAQAVYPLLSFIWSAIWLAEQALDQTASRHLFNWRATRDALTAVRPAGVGMGLVLAAVFLIPLANFFLVPLATVAGALFYCDLQESAAMPAPRDLQKAS